jgi:hypothetical protein
MRAYLGQNEEENIQPVYYYYLSQFYKKTSE